MSVPIEIARVLIAEAQAWFTGLSISAAKQELWGEAITAVAALEAIDVQVALRVIALRPKVGYWRLEIAEIIELARTEAKLRVLRAAEKEARLLKRTALPANATVHPSDTRRAAIARDVWCDVVLRRVHGTDVGQEITRRMRLSPEAYERERAVINQRDQPSLDINRREVAQRQGQLVAQAEALGK